MFQQCFNNVLVDSHHRRCRSERGGVASVASMPTMHDRSEVIFERTISEHTVEGKEETAETAETAETEETEAEGRTSEEGGGMVHTALLRILYRQRHLKLRGMQRRLLGLLNYCRSVQKKLTVRVVFHRFTNCLKYILIE